VSGRPLVAVEQEMARSRIGPVPSGKSFLMYILFYTLNQIRRHILNAMLLGMKFRILEDLFICFTTNDVLAAARWVDLRAFQDF
jgi:hypothetical protein